MEQCETLLNKLMSQLREDQQPALRQRIEGVLASQPGVQQGDQACGLRFLQDLDIFVNMRGADFMYSRGIAETLRVGEDIFELAYVMRRARA